MLNSVSAINHTVEKSHLWIKALKDLGHFSSDEVAYSALHAVLHTLRDRLPTELAAHFSAELPMLIRGLFYEGWKPSKTPCKMKTQRDFFEAIKHGLNNTSQKIDPKHSVQSVFQLLKNKISPGEIENIINVLPKELADLWEMENDE